ncbi:MAG: hemerythrin domain-containing protein [Proteobacteria bacterium]|nr:hemerythrin domain-containing protein [Pseudomonadota bacterium]
MSDIIAGLREDHVRTAGLLRLIEDEVEIFLEGNRPDYELVGAIVEYALTYPDLVHHPTENLVLKRLRAKLPEIELSIGDLVMEHHRLAALTRRFHAALVNILSDASLPREWFAGIAKEYIDFTRRHMQMEEVVFFPAAEKNLDAADWKAVRRSMPKTIDPLSLDSPGQGLAAVRERLDAIST